MSRDAPDRFNRLKARGSIEQNWQDTQRLFEQLRTTTGLCPERPDDDGWPEHDWPPHDGVWFALDAEEGTIQIRDGEDIIGNWSCVNRMFVLCMENHRRPFFQTPSTSVACQQMLDLIKAPARERKRFESAEAKLIRRFVMG